MKYCSHEAVFSPKKMQLRTKTALFALVGFLFFLSLFLLRTKNNMKDFEVNYEAGKRIVLGETLYRFDDGHYMFKYFPCSALLYVPVSSLPLLAAKAIWYALVVFCSVFLFYFSHKLTSSSQKTSCILIVLPPLILARYFFREMDLGQINALVATVLMLMVWMMIKDDHHLSPRNDFFSGCLWGFATALKPYAFIFFPYFIIKKKWNALVGGFLFIFLALLTPSLFYGFRGNLIVFQEWYSTLSQSTPSQLATLDNISLIGFFMKWTGNQTLSLALSGIAVGGLGLLVLVLIIMGKKVCRPEVLESAVLLICIPLVSPLGWDYTLLISVLGVTILVYNLPNFSSLLRTILFLNFFIIAFSLYDILGREMYSRFMTWSIPTLNFLLVIGFLFSLRARKIC